ncbi:white collar 2 type of transcription factor [Neophaeococcomyces mojaviensis]|uniref:White collar 2 type of transcription factor n=1 Tax=Neophaeococcomyces mojaviensis TaxID=3383035 RepID=A0ACC3AKY5_9EURO|nr:white collar 2 type of transcription factor [Knufia sp. JES_112]
MDYQTDASMMDMASFNPGMLNANMMNAMNMNQYSDDIAMDMGDVSAVPFNSIETMSTTIPESDHSVTGNDGMSMSGIGAGPLPTGFGAQAGMGSTLTEFTKRRNWSQRVIEELKDLLYILTPDARFLYLSPSLKLLTGFDPPDLTGKFIHDYIHADDSSLFIREFNESIATGHALRMFYRFRNKDNKYTIFECHGHPHLTNDVSHLELTGGPRNNAGFCAGFFMMARPYPTKNAVLLDSFLEHKLENERLQARINALRREEAEEAEAQARHFHKKATGAGSLTPSAIDGLTTSNLNTGGESPSIFSERLSTDFSSMPPPAKPTISNMALTREALDEANAFARPDSITDKMARYEGSSHVDSIEMLTGLRYREGERAHGISTGGSSPALIRGDAGIDIPAEKTDPRYGASYLDKKPKKVKSADEYVCTDCGTLDSPEWRKGPNGPKTLCNACGLRWAKKEKKRNGSISGGTGGNTVMSGTANSGSSGHGPGNPGATVSSATMTPQIITIGMPQRDSTGSS